MSTDDDLIRLSDIRYVNMEFCGTSFDLMIAHNFFFFVLPSSSSDALLYMIETLNDIVSMLQYIDVHQRACMRLPNKVFRNYTEPPGNRISQHISKCLRLQRGLLE